MAQSNLPKGRHSFWLETGYRNDYPAVQSNLRGEVGVVGGGMAGILTAYTLAKEGYKVILLEGRKFVNGTTGYTTAKLSAQHQLIYKSLIERYDQQFAKLFYEANMEGIAYIEEIVKAHHINCQFKKEKAYVYTEDKKKKDLMEQEEEAYKALGIDGTLLHELPMKELSVEAALEMNHQAQFQPVSFLHHVLDVLKEWGVQIYENSLVVDTSQSKNQKEVTLTLENNCTVICEKVVFATHFPAFDPDDLYTDIEAHMSYGLALKATKLHPEGMYINDDIPKRTFRKMEAIGTDYLLVGGQSHPVGDDRSEMERYEELAKVAKETFGETDIVYRWSSHDLMTKDRIPWIGVLHPDYPKLYTLTGFNKWGLANAAVGAKLIADLIDEKENRYEKLYSPQRDIPDIEGNDEEDDDSISEIDVSKEVEHLQENEATVIEKDDMKIGVYRDSSGELHHLDITCTHLGCSLSWNDGDYTWDCPCHGSRFNATGKVIEGPALKDLSKESSGS